jgi:hypothetical protein
MPLFSTVCVFFLKTCTSQSLTNLFDACGGAALNKVPKAGWARRTGWDREAVANMSRDARPFYEDVNNWDGVDTSAGRVIIEKLARGCGRKCV